MEVLPFEQWRELLENTLPEDAALTRQARAASGKPAEKQALVQNLIDRHGTGRIGVGGHHSLRGSRPGPGGREDGGAGRYAEPQANREDPDGAGRPEGRREHRRS